MVDITVRSYRYGEGGAPGLGVLNLRIEKGECVLLCGESGCGKTTVTRLVNGLIPHFYEGALEGSVRVAGKDTVRARTDELARRTGSVFQNPRSQFFNLDAAGEIAFGCENLGLPPAEIRERVEGAAAALGIRGLLDRGIFALSGGEKQLVALASVYALGPEILVLDEPSSNLDAGACRELAGLLARLKRAGKTIIIAEHRLYYLAGLFDRVVYLKNGAILRDWGAGEFSALPEEERLSLGLRAPSLDGVRPRGKAAPAAMPPAAPSVMPASASVSPPPPKLRVSGLEAGYGRKRPVLRGLSFEAAPGEIIGIAGKNGAGKSTLARVLCGLRRESAGKISLGGRPLPPSKRPGPFYLVMQESSYQLFTDSVEHELYLSRDKKSRPSAAKVEAVLEDLELGPYRERHPMSLSGGQKQRTAVGTALTHEARVLVFDEPSSGLDYRNMRRVAAVMEELGRRERIVFVVTHDYELLLALCTRVIMLEEGRIAGDVELTDEVPGFIRNLWA
ncbi:MAG: energy-coupling factor ABC transporter ATP-binding protein [Treponema sp.]|jgi:energy-coupling factor transport system ATP-binding protein|nr:energy-coupling factor ABC transporter ATP-binding protein [Treponema sp.]